MNHSGTEEFGNTTGRLAVGALGNTRCRVGVFEGAELRSSGAMPAGDRADGAVRDSASAIAAELGTLLGDAGGTIALASVNPPLLAAVERALGDTGLGDRVVVLGRDLPFEFEHRLDDASTLGHDRILCAMAAYETAQSACVIVDAGTAVTIDFVDGAGVFCGGLILPGLRAMLAAMHRTTAQLPEVAFDPALLTDGPFGKHTRHAMHLGVVAAVKGAVRVATEQFAEAYEAYPRVIATGGDAAIIAEEGFVEHVVPDLLLTGMRLAIVKSLDER